MFSRWWWKVEVGCFVMMIKSSQALFVFVYGWLPRLTMRVRVHIFEFAKSFRSQFQYDESKSVSFRTGYLVFFSKVVINFHWSSFGLFIFPKINFIAHVLNPSYLLGSILPAMDLSKMFNNLINLADRSSF